MYVYVYMNINKCMCAFMHVDISICNYLLNACTHVNEYPCMYVCVIINFSYNNCNNVYLNQLALILNNSRKLLDYLSRQW